MKPIRTLLWCMLLHHQPGVCAPAEDEHISDGRVRRHLLGATGDVVTAMRERIVAALESQVNYGRAELLAWAAREIGRVQAASQDSLRDLLGEIQEDYERKAEKALREAQAIENKQQPQQRL